MYVKTEEVKTDWLSNIDGMTVSDAIAYLKTLNQDMTLEYSMEGDTHGCNVTSCLSIDVPMSNQEIYNRLVTSYKKQIDHYQKAKLYYFRRGQFDRLSNCALRIAKLSELIDTAKIKYGK